MASVGDILDFLSQIAPVDLKMDFDNVGLLIGRRKAEVKTCLTTLDITLDAVGEAVDAGAELVVSHHPLFFELKSITDDDVTGRRLLALAENRISAICMHTNLDAAEGGVNDCLAAALGLKVLSPLDEAEKIGRICLAPETDFNTFLRYTCAALSARGLRYYDAGRPVRNVGVCGGAGGNYLAKAFRAGCDTYVSSEIKHHQMYEAAELGMNIIDAGHFPTENVVTAPLTEKLANEFPDVRFEMSGLCRQAEKYYIGDF